MRQELRKGNRSIVSRQLYEMIAERLEKKEQVILFLNRRGYNSCLSCRDCGDSVMCPHCDVSLSLHKNNLLMCHYCGYTMRYPEKCPSCGSKLLGGFGVGTEKIEDELHKLFPNVRTLRLDRDSTTAKGARDRVLNSFRKHEADILVGTQMIVKGHDFPDVTLVGTIIADVSLFENDYRAGERTFQLLTQAAGRAGRGEAAGYSIIQTYKPEHYAIQAAKKQDYADFYETEMAYRRLMKYPPVYNLLVILVQSTESVLVERSADELRDRLRGIIGENKNIRMIGPSDASIAKKNDRYRKVIYIKSADLAGLQNILQTVDDYRCENVSVSMDMNPMDCY
jgi:primosomal protein N' (replication factor Y)